MPFRSVRTYWSTGPSSGALNLEKIVKVLQGTVRVLLDVNTTEIDLRKLGIHTKETRIERDACTPMFIATLFIIVRTWKQPRCPSADEWILLPFLRGYLLSFSSISLITKRKKFRWHQTLPCQDFSIQVLLSVFGSDNYFGSLMTSVLYIDHILPKLFPIMIIQIH